MEANRANRLVAEGICGYTVYSIPTETGDKWAMVLGKRTGFSESIPDYMTDRNAVAEMEEAIEKAGKGFDYISALWEILGVGYSSEIWVEQIKFRRATPEECVKAALKTFGLWED